MAASVVSDEIVSRVVCLVDSSVDVVAVSDSPCVFVAVENTVVVVCVTAVETSGI